MKRLLIFVFLMTGFVAVNAQGANPPPPMRSMRVEPVVIRYDNNILTVYFYQDLGNVTVSVSSIQGQYVYLDQTGTPSTLTVKTGSWQDDAYILSVRNKDGILKEILFYKDE